MSNSAQAVKDKLKNISKDKNVDFNSVMRFYMYDRFIERLSKSKYKDNFILTFDANGGTVSPASISAKYDSTIGPLPTPTRTGYTFTGWYTASNGGTVRNILKCLHTMRHYMLIGMLIHIK